MSALNIFYKRSIFEYIHIHTFFIFARYESFIWKAKLISCATPFDWKELRNVLQIMN